MCTAARWRVDCAQTIEIYNTCARRHTRSAPAQLYKVYNATSKQIRARLRRGCIFRVRACIHAPLYICGGAFTPLVHTEMRFNRSARRTRTNVCVRVAFCCIRAITLMCKQKIVLCMRKIWYGVLWCFFLGERSLWTAAENYSRTLNPCLSSSACHFQFSLDFMADRLS